MLNELMRAVATIIGINIYFNAILRGERYDLVFENYDEDDNDSKNYAFKSESTNTTVSEEDQEEVDQKQQDMFIDTVFE